MLGSGIRRALLSCFSWAQLFAIPRAVSHQAPLSMGFSRQEKLNGFPCPPPTDLPDPGIKPISHVSCVGRPVPYHKRHLRSTLISDLYPAQTSENKTAPCNTDAIQVIRDYELGVCLLRISEECFSSANK